MSIAPMARPTSPQHQLSPRPVKMLNGQETEVLTEAEATYYTRSRDAYERETHVTDNTDLRDLDRLLVFELMIFRWQQWLFSGFDYEGDYVEDPRKLAEQVKYYSDQINKIKDSMGLAKKVRDAAASEGNFSAWLSDLKARARIFGIHREEQLGKALVLMNELSTIISTYDRADTEEKRKAGFEDDHAIVGWCRDIMLPEYQSLDEHFRTHEQQYWVRDM